MRARLRSSDNSLLLERWPKQGDEPVWRAEVWRAIVPLYPKILLPRYVGVLRYAVRGHWFAVVLCDTTDIRREHPNDSNLLAILPADANLMPRFESGYPHVPVR